MSPIKRKLLSIPLVGVLRSRFAAHPAQSMLEFALALPILLLLVFGVIEFGRLLQAWLALENGARFAVRYAITGSYDFNFCTQAAVALDHADNRPAFDVNGNVINMNHVQLDLLDGAANCVVPPKYGSIEIDNSQEISSALQDWARLPSIRATALTGATGIAWNPDAATSGDYQAYLDNAYLTGDLSQAYRGNPSLPGYFSASICSNRVTAPDGNFFQFNPNAFYFSPVEPGDPMEDYRFPVYCQYAAAPTGASVVRYVDDAGGPGDRVRVVLTYRHTLITPFLSTWWPTLLLTSEREGIVEKFRTSRVTGLTGSINVAATWTYTSPPNTETPTPTTTLTPSYCEGTGTILMEWWDGIGGDNVSDLTGYELYPNESTGYDYPTSFELPSSLSSNGSRESYGTRWRGYVCSPYTGQYTFWLASDNNSELYISSNADPDNISKIAYLNTWTNSRQWDAQSSQRSSPITLQAGTFYYIEARHKEGNGGDHLAVGWDGPGVGETPTVIDGLYLKPVSYIPAPTRTPTSTPAPVCSALTNLGGSEALMFRENSTDIESWLSNTGNYNVRLTGAQLNGGLVWHNDANSAPSSNNFRFYRGDDDTIYDPPDTSAFPIAHNWPNTNAAVISPGSQLTFRWRFNNNFFLTPYVRSYPKPGSGTPTPSYNPGPTDYQGFFWPSDLNGKIYYAVGNPPGLTVTCTMEVTGGKGPEIDITYRNNKSTNINSDFWARANVTWNSVASNKDYIYLYVYNSSGALVHWTEISGSTGPLCLFGTQSSSCRSRAPYEDTWAYDGTDNDIQITNGTYTIVALAKGRTSSINGTRRTKSEMVVDTFTINAVVPTPTRTLTSTRTSTLTTVPTITRTPTRTIVPSRTLTPTKTTVPSVTRTPTKSPVPSRTPTSTQTNVPQATSTRTRTSTATNVPTVTTTGTATRTATTTQTPIPTRTRTRTPTKTECQIPIEQGGCQ